MACHVESPYALPHSKHLVPHVFGPLYFHGHGLRVVKLLGQGCGLCLSANIVIFRLVKRFVLLYFTYIAKAWFHHSLTKVSISLCSWKISPYISRTLLKYSSIIAL